MTALADAVAISAALVEYRATCRECGPECWRWQQEQAQIGAQLCDRAVEEFRRVFADAALAERLWERGRTWQTSRM